MKTITKRLKELSNKLTDQSYERGDIAYAIDTLISELDLTLTLNTPNHVHLWSVLYVTFADGLPRDLISILQKSEDADTRKLLLAVNGITTVLIQCTKCGETKTVEMSGK